MNRYLLKEAFTKLTAKAVLNKLMRLLHFWQFNQHNQQTLQYIINLKFIFIYVFCDLDIVTNGYGIAHDGVHAGGGNSYNTSEKPHGWRLFWFFVLLFVRKSKELDRRKRLSGVMVYLPMPHGWKGCNVIIFDVFRMFFLVFVNCRKKTIVN